MLGALAFIEEALADNEFDFESEQWTYPSDHPFFGLSRSEPEVIANEVNRSWIKLEHIRKTIQGE